MGEGPDGAPPGPGGGGGVDEDWLAAALARVAEEEAEQAALDEPLDLTDQVVADGRVTVEFPTSHAGAVALPEVRSLAALAAHDGDRVRIVGTWEALDVRMRPVGGAVYRGHVRVRLADEASAAVLVMPMWSDEARRSVAEVRRYQGRTVAVVGTAVMRAPEAPDRRATAIGPCLITVEAVLAD